MESIPINTSIPNNGKFEEGTSIDSQIYFENPDDVATRLGLLGIQKNAISFRDIVKLLNKYLKDARWDKTIVEKRSNQLQQIGFTYPLEYLLFDFCLAALDKDYLDARLYLSHAFHILGLHKSFNLLLSVIVNECLAEEENKEVREFLTLLGRATEPRSASSYIDIYGEGFKNRYQKYLKELKQIK